MKIVHSHNFQFFSNKDIPTNSSVMQQKGRRTTETCTSDVVVIYNNISWFCFLCKLTQAGCRNNHKTTDEMQIYSHYLGKQGSPEAAPGQRHTSGNADSAQLSPCWRIMQPRGLHRCNLPLYFGLWSSRAGISSMFDTVPLSQAYVI